MSVDDSDEWGSLQGDRAVRYLRDSDGGDDLDDDEIERRESQHEWPSEIRYYASTSLTLPGMGDQPASCQSVYPMDFCVSCGRPSYRESTCEQQQCPHCWRAWSRRRSEGIARRMAAARVAEDDGIDRRAIHAVASPPVGSVRTLKDVQDMMGEAYELAVERGIRGGVAIPHGWRATDAAKQLYREEKEAGVEDAQDGIWAWIREQDRDWREYTSWEPHVHIIGLCRDLEADEGDDPDEWRVRRLSSMSPMASAHDKGAYESMVGASMYLLSHSIFNPQDSRSQSVRWFGDLANSKFSPEKAVSEGLLSTIERYAREASSPGGFDGEGDVEEVDDAGSEPAEKEGECLARTEGCDGTAADLEPIWNAFEYLLDREWCRGISRQAERELSTAYEWMIGEVQPPPGMRYPETEEQAREALNRMV